MWSVAYVMIFIATLACRFVDNFVGFIGMFLDVNVLLVIWPGVFFLESGYISDVLISSS
jgi:hypothetical protein